MLELYIAAGTVILALTGPISILTTVYLPSPEESDRNTYDARQRNEQIEAICVSVPMVVGAAVSTYGLLCPCQL